VVIDFSSVPALFAALSFHAIVIRRKDAIRGQLAENKSRQCMLALSELSKSWPVGGWILQLFNNLLNRLTGREFGFGITNFTKTAESRGFITPGALYDQQHKNCNTSNGLDGNQFRRFTVNNQTDNNDAFAAYNGHFSMEQTIIPN
jgi:hypothetical protein